MDYKIHKIYRRIDSGVALYICLERLSDSFFAVHQMEIIPASALKSAQSEISARFLYLFLDVDPKDRCDWFSDLSIAIEEYDREFGDC